MFLAFAIDIVHGIEVRAAVYPLEVDASLSYEKYFWRWFSAA